MHKKGLVIIPLTRESRHSLRYLMLFHMRNRWLAFQSTPVVIHLEEGKGRENLEEGRPEEYVAVIFDEVKKCSNTNRKEEVDGARSNIICRTELAELFAREDLDSHRAQADSKREADDGYERNAQ